jgi:hypothetical protein
MKKLSGQSEEIREMPESVTPLELPLSQTKNRCLKGKITVRFLGTAIDLTAVSR